ncbi:MAG: VWA domain-containing protein [SAR324 cluster bacterium]|nr:VWA domain-containing protein [SAR324 cluster bacterium]
MTWNQPWAFAALLALPLLWWWAGRTIRGSRSPWWRLVYGFRILCLLLMAGALAQPVWWTVERRTDWLFLVDRSASIAPASAEWMDGYLQRARQALQPDDRLGVVSFGADTRLTLPLGSPARPMRNGDGPDPGATELNGAIAAALAELGESGRRRIVLLTDGNATAGDGAEAGPEAIAEVVAQAARRGVSIYPLVPPHQGAAKEVALRRIVLPPRVRPGEAFQVAVTAYSSVAADAELEFRFNRTTLHKRVRLQPGRNVFHAEFIAEEAGLQPVEAIVHSPGDRLIENNRLLRLLAVEGGTRVLLVRDNAEHSRPLVRALEIENLRVAAIGPEDFPRSLSELLPYDVLLFDNVPAPAFSTDQMELIQVFVEEFGGGFAMVGSDRSFGAGEYSHTAVERILPVNMEVPERREIPYIALMMVIDNSESMEGRVANARVGSKLEVAKLASYSAIELLRPTDRVGVVSFNSTATRTVPMVQVKDLGPIPRILEPLAAEGGTDLYAGLEAAVEDLRAIRAFKRHIIVLSDGVTRYRKFDDLVKAAAQEGITLSTVSFGYWGDKQLLRRLASWGQGQHYHTRDPTQIPSIFTKEATRIARNILEEVEFQPLPLDADHEILRGISAESLPVLRGFVFTTAKAGADVVIAAPHRAPLLAVQRFGLGRTVAFSSDLSTAWGKHWVDWPQYPRLVAQMVRWAERRTLKGELQVRASLEDGVAVVVADAYGVGGHYLNEAQLHMRVDFPDRTWRDVKFAQVAPGRYRAEFPARQEGGYRLAVAGRGGSEGLGPKLLGFAVPYPPEYATTEPNPALLAELAEATGGALLEGGDAEAHLALMAEGASEEPVAVPLWPYLLVAALGVFVLDIAYRQIVRDAG